MSNDLVTNRSVAENPGTEATEADPGNPGKKAPAKKATPKGKGKQVADGETCGYRDVKGGGVERKIFADGWLPAGWHDTPAKCKNECVRGEIPLAK